MSEQAITESVSRRRRGGGVRRVVLLLVAVGCAAGAAVLSISLASTSHRVTVGGNVFVNRPRPIDANNSPTLARNPQRPTNLVLTHRVDRPGFSAALDWSLDGGRSWGTTSLPLPLGKDRPFAPDVAFGPDGTLFVSYVNLQGNGNTPETLWVARSEDGGRTLQPPVKVAGPLAFQARVVVDRSGVVHLTWLQAASVGFLQLTGGPNPVVASHSDDRGRTFSAPVVVSDPARERVAAASPVVDARGDLVVLYEDFTSDHRDFEYLDGPPAEDPFALVVTRSNDGGKTFSRGVVVDDGLVAYKRFLVFLPEFPSVAAGAGGDLYVAWADGRNGDADVLVRRSPDGGRTWDAPVRVNDNHLGDHTSQYLPRIAVAPNGRVDVLFLDRRLDPKNKMTDAWLATSYDRGRHFHDVRVSSRSFDSTVGPAVDEKQEIDFGSRLGLVSTDAGSIMAWTDSRLGDRNTGRQDIAAASAQVRTVGPPAGRVAAAAGLLAVAGIALVALWATGRRRSGSDDDDDEPVREPAGVDLGVVRR
ncbi:MAG TPA: sialidase family protein [Acidimicrobiales bacterium]|nr:sialidase family protein [Acidimicrobiales bacterium]